MRSPKKMLALLDGSERSRKTLSYIASVNPFREAHIVLFQVYKQLPEVLCDLPTGLSVQNTIDDLRAWEREYKKEKRAFMEKARQYLLDEGFNEDNVTVRLFGENEGVARDILAEARNGYDLVIMRRRGMGSFQETVLGSVSQKLLSKLADIPVVLAGKAVGGKKMLIAVDGSWHSVRAVDVVADILGGDEYFVELLHVVRGVDSVNPFQPNFMPTAMREKIEEEVARQFLELKKKLVAAGFPANNISEKIITGADSRAEAILQEAESEKCSAIVVGRKGISNVEDFFMGRVSNKIIHSSQNHTVWIV